MNRWEFAYLVLSGLLLTALCTLLGYWVSIAGFTRGSVAVLCTNNALLSMFALAFLCYSLWIDTEDAKLIATRCIVLMSGCEFWFTALAILLVRAFTTTTHLPELLVAFIAAAIPWCCLGGTVLCVMWQLAEQRAQMLRAAAAAGASESDEPHAADALP